jgi:hypothetical protein
MGVVRVASQDHGVPLGVCDDEQAGGGGGGWECMRFNTTRPWKLHRHTSHALRQGAGGQQAPSADLWVLRCWLPQPPLCPLQTQQAVNAMEGHLAGPMWWLSQWSSASCWRLLGHAVASTAGVERTLVSGAGDRAQQRRIQASRWDPSQQAQGCPGLRLVDVLPDSPDLPVQADEWS